MSEREGMEFLVSVLQIDDRDPELLDALRDNATRFSNSLWLFEGDWELTLLEHTEKIKCLGEIVVPSLGGKTWPQIRQIVSKQIQLPTER